MAVCKNIFRTEFILGIFLLISSCANVVTPSGGPKDVTPPSCIRSTPADSTINFAGNEIRFRFNEFFQLKDIGDNFIVSPFIQKAPAIDVRNRDLIIRFREPLLANTTYSLNFGNAIVDITEQNPARDFNFTFSTGPVIDTIAIHGYVKDAFTQEPSKKVWVMAYKNLNDSISINNKPDYYTKTNNDGSYRINGLKRDSLKIFALNDLNNDLIFNQPTESIAFINEDIELISDTSIDLRLFMEDRKEIFVKSSSASRGKIQIVFNRPVASFNLLTDKLKLITELSESKDTLLAWYTDTIQDSSRVIVEVNDKVLDTLEFALKVNPLLRGKGEVNKLLIQSEFSSTKAIHKESPPLLVFSNPIRTFDKDSIIIFEGELRIFPTFIFVDSLKRKLKLGHQWKRDSLYILNIKKGGFQDMNGLTNDSLKWNFNYKEEGDYAFFYLNVNLPEENRSYQIDLLNESGKAVKTINVRNSGKYIFNFLNPGKYNIRIIEDRNSNMKWDSGNYLEKKDPESVVLFPEPIELKKNWELVQEWSPVFK